VKRSFIVFLALAALICGNLTLPASAEVDAPAKGAHIVAYYFHGSFRCPTCKKLEQYSKEAITSNFKDELASGKLEFKVVNVEDKGNEHYTGDYQLFTKSLVLSKVVDGKEASWKNLDKIWDLVGDKDRFVGYVKDEVTGFLKE